MHIQGYTNALSFDRVDKQDKNEKQGAMKCIAIHTVRGMRRYDVIAIEEHQYPHTQLMSSDLLSTNFVFNPQSVFTACMC